MDELVYGPLLTSGAAVRYASSATSAEGQDFDIRHSTAWSGGGGYKRDKERVCSREGVQYYYDVGEL